MVGPCGHPHGMNVIGLEAELEQAAELMAGPPPAPPGAYQTTPQLLRGNWGERLATEVLPTLGFQILDYKPDIRQTSVPGIDILALRNNHVWLVDNKALSRNGAVYRVSSLTTSFPRNLQNVRKFLSRVADDPKAPDFQRTLYRQALQNLNAGRFVRAVSNANVALQNKIPNRVSPRLKKQGIAFLDMFRIAKRPTPPQYRNPFRAVDALRARSPRLREQELELEMAAAEMEAGQAQEGFLTRRFSF